MSDTLMFVITFSGFCGLIGIIFALIGIVMLKNEKKLKRDCTSTTFGKVVDLARHVTSNSDGFYSSVWHPVFEYSVGELKYVKESMHGSSKSKYAIGQEVEVYYNPEKPDEYYIEGEQGVFSTVFTIVGIGVMIIAVFSAVIIL